MSREIFPHRAGVSREARAFFTAQYATPAEIPTETDGIQ